MGIVTGVAGPEFMTVPLSLYLDAFVPKDGQSLLDLLPTGAGS